MASIARLNCQCQAVLPLLENILYRLDTWSIQLEFVKGGASLSKVG